MTTRDKILKEVDRYYKELDKSDFSHNFDHVIRVEKLAKRIGKDEGADQEILEAACLLFDVARGWEDKGKVKDHAQAGAKIARNVLSKVGFPAEKIDGVCHAILVHRKSKKRKPKTLEAKILQDADYLDAMGAVDVARVIASALQSKKYKKPVYVEVPSSNLRYENISAIHYLLHKLKHNKMKPKNFHTKLGRELAKGRFEFMKQFAERFIAEWHGRK